MSPIVFFLVFGKSSPKKTRENFAYEHNMAHFNAVWVQKNVIPFLTFRGDSFIMADILSKTVGELLRDVDERLETGGIFK